MERINMNRKDFHIENYSKSVQLRPTRMVQKITQSSALAETVVEEDMYLTLQSITQDVGNAEQLVGRK